jgi:hypothetical protein
MKGAKVIFGEMYGLVMHCLHSSSILYIKYGMVSLRCSSMASLLFMAILHCSIS